MKVTKIEGLLTLVRREITKHYPGLVFAMFLLAPALFRNSNAYLVNWLSALPLAFSAAALLTFLMKNLIIFGERHWRSVLLLFVYVGLLFGYTVVAYLNVRLDSSQAQNFEVKVLQKDEGIQSRRFVSMAPWGPIDEARKIRVARKFYENVEVGDFVCVRLYQGQLNLPWFSVDPCAKPQ